MSHSFNSDLFLGEADLETAKRAFPRVFYALDNPTLRAAFAIHDVRANSAKTKSRTWGVTAVALATLALILAASSDLYAGYGQAVIRVVAMIGAVAGVGSVAIAVLGVMYRTKKIRWLTDRLATERLRQFHFQQYVARAKEILEGSQNPAAADAYRRQRDADFEKLNVDLLSRLDAEFNLVVETDDPGDGLYFPEASPKPSGDASLLNEYFSAYETLRLRRQIDYCNLLLSDNRSIWKNAPARQAKLFAGVAMALILLILTMDATMFIGAVAGAGWITMPVLQAAGITLAFIALAVRTLEEGFQVEAETARMRHYRHTLLRIFSRFKEAPAPEAKLAAMADLEKTAYEEMVTFLKSHHDAEFVM